MILLVKNKMILNKLKKIKMILLLKNKMILDKFKELK